MKRYSSPIILISDDINNSIRKIFKDNDKNLIEKTSINKI
jgi:hypothetical protein